MTTALVAGATSYLGSLCLPDLHRAGWRLLRSGRDNTADLIIDFSRTREPPSAAHLPHVDVFINFAAATEIVSKEDPLKAYRVNVLGLRTALDFCLNNDIRHFLQISTRHVFGRHGSKVTEESDADPLGHYGMSKLLADQLVLNEKRLRCSVLRLSNVFGSPACLDTFRRWSIVQFAFCKSAIQRQEIVLNSHGLQPINFLPSQAVSKLIESYEQLPCLRHVTGPVTRSVRQFAELVAQIAGEECGRQVKVRWIDDDVKNQREEAEFLHFGSRYGPVTTEDHLPDFIRATCRRIRDSARDD